MTAAILAPQSKSAPVLEKSTSTLNPLEQVFDDRMDGIRVTYTLRSKAPYYDDYNGFQAAAVECHHIVFRNDGKGLFVFSEDLEFIADRALDWAKNNLDLEKWNLVQEENGLLWRNTPIDEPF